jgi:MerR family transcriptional regulator, redox-sensitive transcriptional activator SoxR
MNTLAIGEVARRVGIRASALRYYESVGLLPITPRVNGRRRYDPIVLRRIALLQVAQQAGFSIAEIRTLLIGFNESVPPPERWRRLATRKLDELDGVITRARDMQRLLREGLRCNCLRWEACDLINRRKQRKSPGRFNPPLARSPEPRERRAPQ